MNHPTGPGIVIVPSRSPGATIRGIGQAENEVGVGDDGVNKSIWASHLNLMWSPVAKVRLGAEWLHAYRELENGTDGSLNRIQFSGRYLF